MNCFRTILNSIAPDGLSLQGDQAMLHALLVISAAGFDAAETDAYSTGALSNPVRDALRRWRAMGVREGVVTRLAQMLNTQAAMFGG